MSYSIGDVSRMLGMTTSALHYYEKEGIIDTPKEESGRRYYEDADVMRLISAKKYRSMGVSLHDIAEQFASEGMTGQQVISRMREKRLEAAREAARYAALEADIARLITRSEEGIPAEGVVDVRRAEDMLMLRGTQGALVPHDHAEQRLARGWLEAMPAVSVSIARRRDGERADFALMIPRAQGEALGLAADSPAVSALAGGMAIHAVVACGEEQYDQPDIIFRPILAFAREHRFRPAGPMWGCMLLVDCSGGRRRHYYDTYMPFM